MNTVEELQKELKRVTDQRDDAIKIALMIINSSTVTTDKSLKHVHKYAVDMLEMMRHTIPYKLNWQLDE